MLKKLGKSKFLNMFGGSVINRLLDFLVVFDDFDYSMKDLSVKNSIGYSTLKILLPEMVSKGILKITRINGKSKMYKLDIENEMVKEFILFYWNLNKVQKPKMKEIWENEREW